MAVARDLYELCPWKAGGVEAGVGEGYQVVGVAMPQPNRGPPCSPTARPCFRARATGPLPRIPPASSSLGPSYAPGSARSGFRTISTGGCRPVRHRSSSASAACPCWTTARCCERSARVLAELDLRGIVAAGWSELDAAGDDSLFVVDEVDHQSLFPRCAAAVHHGGAGTTATTAGAGIPARVCSVFADQPFWGRAAVRSASATRFPSSSSMPGA